MTTKNSTLLIQRMKETVAFSSEHVKNGGIPFTAMVVDKTGAILGRGVNRVCEHHDPTAHAEVDAIRDACRSQRLTHLHGAILLASGEPCAMCYTNALFAGIKLIFFAVDRNEVALYGFDYRNSYSIFGHDPLNWQSPKAQKLMVPEGLKPFLQFNSNSRAKRQK